MVRQDRVHHLAVGATVGRRVKVSFVFFRFLISSSHFGVMNRGTSVMLGLFPTQSTEHFVDANVPLFSVVFSCFGIA